MPLVSSRWCRSIFTALSLAVTVAPALLMAGAKGGLPDAKGGLPTAEDESPVEITAPEEADLRSWLDKWWAGYHRIDAVAEWMGAGDIDLWRAQASYQFESERWIWEVVLGRTDYELDYQPAVFGTARGINGDRLDAQASLGWWMTGDFQWTALLRGYDGYSDYRAVWIDEFYRQFYQGYPGYESPDPWGWAVSLGGRWDYQRGAGRLEFGLGYGEDQIIPAWEFVPGRVSPVREELTTWSGVLRWEQALTAATKLEAEGRLIRTTGREHRWYGRAGMAIALARNWTLRPELGGALEDPDYEAIYGGFSLSYQFVPNWYATLTGRVYEDTGELETSGFETSAPPVRTWEVGLGLRRDDGQSALGIWAGLLDSDFDPVARDSIFFRNLYKDREWWLVRAGYTIYF